MNKKKHKIEFRLVVSLQSRAEAKGYWAGPLAGMGLGYYFHEKKNGNVILDVGIKRAGFGTYYPNKGKWNYLIKNIGKSIECNRRKIFISKTGYIYENAEKAITWQFDLKKIIEIEEKYKKICVSSRLWKEYESKYLKYFPGAIQIVKKEKRGKNPTGYKPIVSGLKMLKIPMTEDSKQANKFQRYEKIGNDKKVSFFPKPYQGANFFICEWPQIKEKKLYKIKNAADLIDNKIRHFRIRESLVHECIKILCAEKEWYANWELQVKGRGKDRGRIDFLIKQEQKNSPWIIMEIKLGDNPNAVEQLQNYYERIKKYHQNTNDEKGYFGMLKGKKRKEVKKVVLCQDVNETKKEAKGTEIEVWKYEFFRHKKSRGVFLGFRVFGPRRKKIISTKC